MTQTYYRAEVKIDAPGPVEVRAITHLQAPMPTKGVYAEFRHGGDSGDMAIVTGRNRESVIKSAEGWRTWT